MEERHTGIVHIEDTDPVILKEFISCLYDDDYEIVGKHVFGLLALAVKYDVLGLKGKCEQWLSENICASNAVRTLLLADQHSCVELANLALNFMALNLASIKESGDWQAIGDDQLPDIIERLLQAKLPTNCKKIREDLAEVKLSIKRPKSRRD